MNINGKQLAFIGVGVATIAVSLYSYYRDMKTAKKVEKAIDNIEEASSVEISEALVKEAVSEMAEKAVGKEVEELAKKIVKDHEADLRKQVSALVLEAKESVKDSVTEEIRKDVASMSTKDLRKEVKLEAKEKVLRKLEKDMDEIMYMYKTKLQKYGTAVVSNGNSNGLFSLSIG